jgi:hypothetical protein
MAHLQPSQGTYGSGSISKGVHFALLPFAIKLPLPEDVSGFQRNCDAIAVRYESRRIVSRRASCRHARPIGVAIYEPTSCRTRFIALRSGAPALTPFA